MSLVFFIDSLWYVVFVVERFVCLEGRLWMSVPVWSMGKGGRCGDGKGHVVKGREVVMPTYQKNSFLSSSGSPEMGSKPAQDGPASKLTAKEMRQRLKHSVQSSLTLGN